MLLNEFIVDVHENAVKHGFWDDRDSHTIEEILALVHAEWSEALEEYRANRPMVWYKVGDDCCTCEKRIFSNAKLCKAMTCTANHKPEGIAIELIDGILRIFDYMGNEEVELTFETLEDFMTIESRAQELLDVSLPCLIANLHLETSRAYVCLMDSSSGESIRTGVAHLLKVAYVVCNWLKAQGYDPEKLLLEKHEYNKTRPYKHGKRC